MSTTLATILVGLGYDLSALEKGSPEAFRLINQQTMNMSAEMKRNARDGAEAFRSIDEMIGIHINRPMTRLLVETFPAFGKALSSVLGGVAFGAVAFAGVELFDRIKTGIEKARKAQEEFVQSQEKVKQIYEDTLQSYDKAAKLRALSGLTDTSGNANGLPKALFETNFAAITEATKHVNELTDALLKEADAAVKAHSTWTELMAGIGDAAHVLTTTSSGMGVEQINQQLAIFKQKYDDLARTDALKGTHQAGTALAAELSKAEGSLKSMQTMKLSGLDETLNEIGKYSGQGSFLRVGFSATEISAQQHYIDQLKQLVTIQHAADTDQSARDAETRKAAALEKEKEDVREVQGDLKAWNDAANQFWQTWIKINDEIDQAMKTLPTLTRHMRFSDLFQVGPPPGAPQLADVTELQKVTDDQNESWKKAGEILEQIETPAQKYATALKILNELQLGGRITTQQYALAQQKLVDDLTSAENRIEQLMRKGGAGSGAQAFLLQWMGTTGKTSDGQFAFDFLNKGLQGFEDETVKALTGAKTTWRQYFSDLDAMALKFLLNKEIAGVFKFAAGTGIGQSLGLGGLLNSTNPMQVANTTALTANTAAVLANTAALSAAGASGAAGGAGLSSLFDAGIPAFAAGTDNAPGGLAMVGENGPELVNLPGGSSVIPNSAMRRSVTAPIYIDARGAQMGVADQIAASWRENGPALITRAVIEAEEVRRRSVR